MRLGICLHRYFAHGGREYNARAIAEEALARGHVLRLYAWDWEGAVPAGAEWVRVPREGHSNHARAHHFAVFVQRHRAIRPLEALLGFQPMPGLDAFYAADSGIGARLAARPWLRWVPRYRTLFALERAVFEPAGRTRILALAPAQLVALRECHGTPAARCILLPPALRADRAAGTDPGARRRAARAALGIAETECVVLALGSGYHTKGLDRTLTAFARLPRDVAARSRLLVAGTGDASSYRRMATRLGIAPRTRFLGGRDDVPELLAASDLLLHPARREATGMVLLEAASAGLPVLASAVCGYAPWIVEHGFGQVLDEPFTQAELDLRLHSMLAADPAQRAAWRAAGLGFAATIAPHARAQRVVDELEALA